MVGATNCNRARCPSLRPPRTCSQISIAVELRTGADGDLRDLHGFGDKAAEMARRIAAVMTTFADLDAAAIDEIALGNAVRLMEFYLDDAVRLHGEARTAIDTGLIIADKLRRWLLRIRQDCSDKPVEFRHMLKCGPAEVRTSKTLDAALKILVKHGWIEKEAKSQRFTLIRNR